MYLITDKYSGNQIEGYRSNRHDQSILSILSKIYGCEEKENEVWFKQKEKLQFEYPFLAVNKVLIQIGKKLNSIVYIQNIFNQQFTLEKSNIFTKKLLF